MPTPATGGTNLPIRGLLEADPFPLSLVASTTTKTASNNAAPALTRRTVKDLHSVREASSNSEWRFRRSGTIANTVPAAITNPNPNPSHQGFHQYPHDDDIAIFLRDSNETQIDVVNQASSYRRSHHRPTEGQMSNCRGINLPLPSTSIRARTTGWDHPFHRSTPQSVFDDQLLIPLLPVSRVKFSLFTKRSTRNKPKRKQTHPNVGDHATTGPTRGGSPTLPSSR